MEIIKFIVAVRGRMYKGQPQQLEGRMGGGITNTITSVDKDNYLMEVKRYESKADEGG